MSAFKTGILASPIKVVKAPPRLVIEAQRAWEGPFERVHAKVLPVNSRCIEAVCAWLARDIELPAPEPMLLNMPVSKMPRGMESAWPFGNSLNGVVFATRSIDDALTLDRVGAAADGVIDKWDSLAAAAVFDQLVANDDRTNGNILIAARKKLWLIDHARSLGGGGQRLFSTDVMPLFENYFLSRISGYPILERQKLRPALMGVCIRLVAAVARVPYEQLLVPDEIAMQIANFLSRRAAVLQAMVLQAVGLPDLYDQGESPRATQ